ncbi:MAG: glycosyltransferase family 4 protein [Methylophilaceae bacterium]|jgi:glycosyltransferase involved in cell wall biosynthesis
MQRLLFIVNVDWFFLSHRLAVALAARDAGFDVHVATVLTGPSEAIERHGFTVHALHMDRRSTGSFDAFRLFWALLSLIRQLRPAVVHLITIKPVLFGGLAARLAGVPKVIAAISGLGYIFNARGFIATLHRSLVSILYRLALVREGVWVIFQNSDDQALLQRHAGIRDSQVIHIRGSGVDLETWPTYPLPESPPRVLMASRLLADKGVCEFVEAARILRGYKSACFVLVGDVDPGNPTSVSTEQVQRWVDEGLIEWWGQRNDMPEVLGMAHMVVLPSYREGLPKVLIEAAASGRPVVTTDVPGCRDAIDPGRSGLLVEARNAAALAQAIKALLDHPLQLSAMGEAGRHLAEQAFDIREVVIRHLAAYGASGK